MVLRSWRLRFFFFPRSRTQVARHFAHWLLCSWLGAARCLPSSHLSPSSRLSPVAVRASVKVSLLFCSSMSSESESQLMEDIKDASSVLHLACLVSDAGMVELLLQFRGKIATAKLLILRFQC
ncbi:ADP-ribosylation factor GTPase-activating protein-like [Arachis hypogaea]|nr:ADP-ribosylation factor GTPase-activating protein-like [Arachis hypogaea]